MPKFLDVTDRLDAAEYLGVQAVSVKQFGAVGDGVTDDRAAIHAARDAAGEGGTLWFPPGTYLIETQSADDLVGGYIFGHGGLVANVAGQTWLLGSAELVLTGWTAFTDPLPDGLTRRENLITIKAPNVSIVGGTLDLSAIEPDVADEEVRSHGIAVWSGNVATDLNIGAHGSNAAGAVIRDVTIKDAPGYGIFVCNTNSVTITGCTLKDCFLSGVVVQNKRVPSSNPDNSDINDFLIHGNRCESIWKSFAAGIYVGADFDGARFEAGHRRVGRARISNNVVVIPRDVYPGEGTFFDGGAESGAIQAIGLDDSVIDGNVTEGGAFGITTAFLRRVTISNNTCRGWRGVGIEISGGQDAVSIASNVLDADGATGPYSAASGLQDPAGTLNVNAYGILASAGESSYGAGSLGFRKISITGNTVTGFTTTVPARAVFFYSLSGMLFDDVTITGNTIAAGGGSGQFNGVEVSGAETRNLVISGNTFDGASRTDSRGVFLVNRPHTGITITGNCFANLARAAFEPVVDTTGTFTDVRFTGNVFQNCPFTLRNTGVAAATRLILDTGSLVTSTATVGGVTNLSVESTEVQRFTGTNTQSVRLPTTDIIIGRRHTIINSSTGAVTVQAASSLATVAVLAAGTSARFTALANSPTAAAQWFVSADYTDARADARIAVGNAATATALQTARTIDGQSFNGSANITVVAPGTTAAADKATPVDADLVPLVDSADSNVLKKLTWSNIKATLKTYFDDLTTTFSNKTLASPALTGTSRVAQSGSVDIFNTADQTTNTERAVNRWNGNVYEIGTLFSGTGTARSLRLGAGANAGNNVLTRAIQVNPAAPFWQFLASGGSTGSLFQVGSASASSFTASSGLQNFLVVDPTINQTSTAGYTALLINPTETATGSGTKRLVDAQTGGTSRFTIDNTGNAFVGGTLDLGNASDTTISRVSAGVIAVEGNTVSTRLTNTATLDFGSVTAQSFADLTITVTGAATGDAVALGTPTAAITAGIAFTAWVSATNTVTVRAHNYTAGALDPASGVFRATVIR